MNLVAAVILLYSARIADSMPSSPGIPENITVTFLNPTSIRVSWDTSVEHVDKYDVTYKPTDARVVTVVAGNSDAVTLSGLKADTQYHLTVAAVWGGKKFRSRPIVFRTMEQPRTFPQQDLLTSFSSESPISQEDDPPDLLEYPHTSSTVRGVEIGIVLLVLVVWIAAIALFFNRWGKIRMLLPYQPDYKQEQLKVPGTGACTTTMTSASSCNHQSRERICAHPPLKPRPRMNSAIFMSNSGPGFDSKEFFRRHGSISKLCRKAQSVDNLSLSGDSHQFGLPMLSISGPSPPEDDEETETDQFLKN